MDERRRYVRLGVDGIEQRALLIVVNGEPGFDARWPDTCSECCFDTIDGQHPEGTVYHPVHGVALGDGCRACRGRGWRLRREWVPLFDRAERKRLGFPEVARGMG